MKNRNTVIVAFLLAAVMILGVGYAAVTDTLDITGTLDAGASSEIFNSHVKFVGVRNALGEYVTEYSADGLYTARVNADNDDKASFTVTGLKVQGDTTTITYKITNTSDLRAVITVRSATNSNAAYFEVLYYVNDVECITTPASVTEGTELGTIAPKTGEMTITVKVTLLHTPVENQSATTTFEFVASGEETHI